MRRATLIPALLTALCTPASAQHPGNAPAPAPAAPAPGEPQRTTATFENWTLRCIRPEKAPAACEVSQVLTDKGQPVAQTALGRLAHGEPMRLTLQVPPNVQLTAPPRLQEGAGGGTLDLTWRRCFQVGCFADLSLTDEQLERLRTRTEPSRITYQDGAGHDVSLPFVPRGLPQALEALAKEDTR